MIGYSCHGHNDRTSPLNWQKREERGANRSHHSKSHLEEGLGLEAAADISTLGGRAPCPGRPARWVQHGRACEDEALGLEEGIVHKEVERLRQ